MPAELMALIFSAGGDNGVSNAQVYLQMGLGYQLTINDGRGLIPIGVHVGIGANAGNCWSGVNAAGNCLLTDNFTMTFANVSAGYLHEVAERFYVGIKALGGVALLDPRPTPEAADPLATGLSIKPNFGGVVSIEYATNMDHFSVGLDISYRLIVGPNINALMFYPRVQYTF